MKGHLTTKNGTWYAIYDVADPATGKRRRKWQKLEGAKGKRDADEKWTEIKAAMKNGTFCEPNKLTVSKYLDGWLADVRPRVSPKTAERYEMLCRKTIAPLLGGVLLTKLKPAQISAALTKALASGRSDGKGGLSSRSVHHAHTVLKSALAQAVKWELIVRNPSDAVTPPRVEQSTMTTYDVAQIAELVEAVQGTRMEAPILLAVMCGLRRGEVAALRWRNVDLGTGQLAIRESAEQVKSVVRYKPPKNGKARTVALPAVVAEALRGHRIRQAQELLKVGIRLSDDCFVVAQPDGSPLKPHSLGQEWVRFVKRTNLPRIRMHDLRHSHATALLLSGVHPKVASERLGHSKVGITLDLYSHCLPGMQEDAATRVDDALRAALKRRATLP